jgi:S1-C subfamily serine protease
MLTVACLQLVANAQNVLTGKEIYRTDCKAVVQIHTEDGFGVGFIVSSDGAIMTANHVVTTRESNFRKFAKTIDVTVPGHAQAYQAQPPSEAPSSDGVNYDSAIIKIVASNLPHLSLGSWDEVEVGDPLTILPSFPGMGCLLLEGIVSAKSPFKTAFGPKPVNTILFQTPIRNGFSGSPIFSARGHVIGIQDTKVFGISPGLDELRTKWAASRSQGTVRIMGVDIAGNFLEMTNNLDQNLISGLGSGVDIGYAKDQQKGAPPPSH